MMQKAVEHGADGRHVAKQFAPVFDWTIGRQQRGPKSKANPLTAENQKLRRDNERLTDRLRKAEIVIDVQKKVAMLLGIPIAESEAL
jgi:hypothetical protein